MDPRPPILTQCGLSLQQQVTSRPTGGNLCVNVRAPIFPWSVVLVRLLNCDYNPLKICTRALRIETRTFM